MCGQNLGAGVVVQFSNKVLGGSLQFVEGYQAYANYIRAEDGKMNEWVYQVQQVISNDSYTICAVSPLTLTPAMKELALQPRKGGNYVLRTLESVRDNSYPLTIHGVLFLNKAPDKPLDPKIEEFVRFILSREGQTEVQREDRYLPLNGVMVARELKKLE